MAAALDDDAKRDQEIKIEEMFDMADDFMINQKNFQKSVSPYT
jgi:hypothetical protein